MRVKEVKVYKFSELSEKAKEQAKQKKMKLIGYNWENEAFASFSALVTHFGSTIRSCHIDFFDEYGSGCTLFATNMKPSEINRRLSLLGSFNPKTGYGHGACKLTGVFTDEEAIDGFRKAWRDGVRDLDQLLKFAFRSLVKACQEDCKHQYSDEAYAEFCDSNDHLFYESGEFVPFSVRSKVKEIADVGT
jgi:hypothetical protein